MVADQPADEVTVLLLDVRVVVLVMGAAAAELDATGGAELDEIVVEELIAIVDVQRRERKRKLVIHSPHRLEHRLRTFSHHWNELTPPSAEVSRR